MVRINSQCWIRLIGDELSFARIKEQYYMKLFKESLVFQTHQHNDHMRYHKQKRQLHYDIAYLVVKGFHLVQRCPKKRNMIQYDYGRLCVLLEHQTQPESNNVCLCKYKSHIYHDNIKSWFRNESYNIVKAFDYKQIDKITVCFFLQVDKYLHLRALCVQTSVDYGLQQSFNSNSFHTYKFLNG